MDSLSRGDFLKRVGAAAGAVAAGAPVFMTGCDRAVRPPSSSGASGEFGESSGVSVPDPEPPALTRDRLVFPGDFLWGTATAAHQVEGGNTNNNWYAFEREPGRVFQDQRSGDACQWWDGRAEEDIGRMVELSTNAHRLSIEWSRLVPSPGRWDQAAVDRYREILLAMREAGIQPMITLHHFTNPLWMEETGGWLNPEAAVWFQRFVGDALRSFGDLCDTWCTINEPNVYSAQGYFKGRFPPGHTDMGEYFRVLHNLLSAHARAYHTIHQAQPEARVGLAKHVIAWFPRHPGNPVGRAVTRTLDGMFNQITLDALGTGTWRPLLGRKGRIDHIQGTLDWIGLNYYQRYDAGFSLRALESLGITYSARNDRPRGPQGWGEFYPDGLFQSVGRFFQQFGIPVYITENGVPDESDSVRPSFLMRHLHRTWEAIQRGWPVKGYFFWSLVDNFEWAEGYDPRFRFGLYGVDFQNQERTLKASGELYRALAGAGAIDLAVAQRYAPDTVAELFGGWNPT